MGLERRLNKLEQQAALSGNGRACPACGLVRGFTPDVTITPAPRVPNLAAALALADDGDQDLCGVCGRRLVFRIPTPQLARLGPDGA
jgi:hypothetical protein